MTNEDKTQEKPTLSGSATFAFVPPYGSTLQFASFRSQPHSIEAEQSVIGGLLVDNTVWELIADVVSERDFYRDEHRRIFSHIVRLIEEGRSADVLTVAESIAQSNESEQTGGKTYLAEVAKSTLPLAHIRCYAEIMREHSVRRDLLKASNEIAALALSPAGRDVHQTLEVAEAKVREITEAGTCSTEGFVAIQPLISQVVGDIEALYGHHRSDIAGIPSGFNDLDKMISGLRPGNLIIVAGKPAMGTTAFALNIAEHVGVEMKLPVAIFTLRTPGDRLARRLLSSVSMVGHTKLRSASLDDSDWDKLTMALSKLHEANIHIDETSGLTIRDLRTRAYRLHSKHGKLGLIIIDDVQLMTAAQKIEHQSRETDEIFRSIKLLAMELQVPVIVLSKLGNKVDKRNDKRPLMSDLREYSAAEQNADVILMLYRDEHYNKDAPDNKGMAEAIVSMNRRGQTGTVKLGFLGNYTKFVDCTSEDG